MSHTAASACGVFRSAKIAAENAASASASGAASPCHFSANPRNRPSAAAAASRLSQVNFKSLR